MKEIYIKKGFTLPIKCKYNSEVKTIVPKSMGLTTDDYKLFKPRLMLEESSNISPFNPVIFNKKDENIKINIPANGNLTKITRGEKRKILSIFCDIRPEFEFEFNADKDNILDTLLECGLFSAFRQRPFDFIPNPEKRPDVIFINVCESRPLSYNSSQILQLIEDDFFAGVQIVSKIASKKTFVCVDENFKYNTKDTDNITYVKFKGAHPAGLTGTHIHYLYPVNDKKSIWHIDFQEVAAIGKLFSRNILSTYRYIAISDLTKNEVNIVKAPMLSNIYDLLDIDFRDDLRIISGNLFYGRKVTEDEPFLGRYDYQITILKEMTERKFMEWALPGKDVFSVKNVFLSKLFGDKNISFDTSMHGSIRPIVPVGSYEKVFPFDIEITHLLRYLSVGDEEMCQKLGILELSEEDLALCTFVCPGKNDYVKMLRETLDRIYYDSF